MIKTIGNFRISVSDQPYPVHIEIMQDGQLERVLRFDHHDLADLHYAIHTADRHARRVLSNVPGHDYSKEMVEI